MHFAAILVAPAGMRGEQVGSGRWARRSRPWSMLSQAEPPARVVLHIDPSRTAAAALCATLGFVLEEELPNCYGGGRGADWLACPQ